MNSPRRSFVNARRILSAARLLAVAGAGALLSGCIGDPHGRAQVDPTSPVAGEVERLARLNKDYPSFSEIPAKPTDVRPVRAFGRAAAEIEQARADLEAKTAPGTWTLTGSESFAATARREAGPEVASPNPTDTETFARELRRRATPPPPPQR